MNSRIPLSAKPKPTKAPFGMLFLGVSRLPFKRPGRHPFAKRCFAALLAAVCCLVMPDAATAGSGSVTASTGHLELPTYPWAAVKHPYFRDTDNVNIYPYPMLDYLSRDKTNRTYRTVVLENEYLRITFLPELGGKIYEVIDKTIGQPIFYVNHVVKPGLIGQCGAWTSGGVEWNTGPQGHTVSCMLPVEVRALPAEQDGSRSVAIGETERIYGTKWTVLITLRPGRSFLEERIRIYNPTETIRPYYFWNCTAVPNTPGFRFVYPMTLGMDHSGEKFFHWPVDQGRDLSLGTNYQDASSIFAYFCDQDFFGSYNDDLGRGVVSYANHHQLPGKKAWTWGHGSYGTMHQADLTDSDGPYNEVQTGPLLTQGEVGRLDPCEAVEWHEWWYPVHGTDGFTYANKNVAVNAQGKTDRLTLRILGSGTWSAARIVVRSASKLMAAASCKINPTKSVAVELSLKGCSPPVDIDITAGAESIAHWQFPLALPKRDVPQKRPAAQTTAELVQAGWQEFLFARFSAAEKRFRLALEKDRQCPEAHVGLAHVYLDPDPAKSADEAQAALAVDPDLGPAHYALAVAQSRLGHPETALEEAWKAALDPATAVPARALIAKLLIFQRRFEQAVEALSEPGPWQSDSVCSDRLSLALLLMGKRQEAISQARLAIKVDALDDFARSVLWMTAKPAERQKAQQQLAGNVPSLLDLAASYHELGCREQAFALLDKLYVHQSHTQRNPLLDYWYAGLSSSSSAGENALTAAFGNSPVIASQGEELCNSWPHDYELLLVLERASELEPQNGPTSLHLGDLLFHLRRPARARQMWQRAAELGAEPVVAYRALGMTAKTLDGDLSTARRWLEEANQADGSDAVSARDLANVLLSLAEKVALAQRPALLIEARDRLKAAFESGKGRSDFVTLLARAQNDLREFAETARMLDRVRVTIWEGAHELHDRFEEAHLALGEEALKAGRPAEALAEFNRALEFPANLATGKLENAPRAHIDYLRGNALAALGKRSQAIAAWKLATQAPESKDARIQNAREKALKALEAN